MHRKKNSIHSEECHNITIFLVGAGTKALGIFEKEVTVTLGKWVTFYNVQLNDAASRNVLQ